ncbi:MAG: phosphodiester glycosidase family protein [Myxococcales bacterium]|nr:phosphodiester glycosidase family protein [Myxococcales bacterium]
MILAPLLTLALSQVPPPWLTRALWDRESIPRAGEANWVQRLAGLETAELDAVLEGTVVDRLHLVRVDPRRFAFRVFHDAERPASVEGWLERLGAVAVVNGSFYLMDQTPETPVKAGGIRLGPSRYRSRHGAFVAGEDTRIIDLRGREVDQALSDYSEAMVSYPLLIDRAGKVRASTNPTWLANRTFVATDAKGRVLLGTTETGFFALTRLGRFLRAAPLGLTAALNLDGGPVACQAVSAGEFRKVIYGQWETNDSTGEVRVFWGYGPPLRWPLPIALAVLPR